MKTRVLSYESMCKMKKNSFYDREPPCIEEPGTIERKLSKTMPVRTCESVAEIFDLIRSKASNFDLLKFDKIISKRVMC